ncbi:MAG: efflux RND transporter periplasmic adaptor subunit [Vicinamibacterales bacterium]
MRPRRLLGIVGAVVVIGLVGFIGLRVLRARGAATPAEDPLVPTTRVMRGPLELGVHAVGELRASKSAMLMAPSVGGTLRILHMLDTGMPVKAGDVIAELDPTEQQYTLEQSKSELEEAEQQILKKKADLDVQTAQDALDELSARFDVRRAELDNLADRDMISANAFAKNQLALDETQKRLAQIRADAKTRIDTNKAALALVEEKRAKAELSATRAQQNIDTLVLKSPIDGLVVIRANNDAAGGFFYSGMTVPSYRAGDNTFAGRALADVYDLSGMELRVKVGEQDRANVIVGQEATVQSDAVAGATSTAKVSAVAGGLNSSDFFDVAGPVRQFDVTLKLDTVDPRLRPGSTVHVLLKGKRVDNVLQVPLQAVRLKNGKPAVFVKTASGFESQEVKVVYRTETRVGLEGLAEGTTVALVDPVAASTTASAPAKPAASGPVK